LALIAAAVIVAAGILGVTYLGAAATVTKTETAVSTAGPINCASAPDMGYPIGDVARAGALPLMTGNNQFQCLRILTIPPGTTTAVLKVAYWTDPSMLCPKSAGCWWVANLTAGVDMMNFTFPCGFPPCRISYVPAAGVTISSNPPSINVSQAGAVNITATYTITVTPGTRGLDTLSFFDACPDSIPLAVGYTASQINATSYSTDQFFSGGCGQLGILPGGLLMSTSGIQTTWLIQSVEDQSVIVTG
jgi:hypothetical protein